MGRPKKTSQIIPVNPLENFTETIPFPWKEIIVEILTREIKLTQPINEGELVLIDKRVKAWRIALHWLIKWQWNYKHKIPVKRSVANVYQTKGKFLQSIFLMCERCHTFQNSIPEITITYPNAAHWFGLIFWDFILHEVCSAYSYHNESKKGAKKAAIIQERQELIRKHKNFENPLPKDTVMEATYNLFEISGKLAMESRNFQRDYWNKFVKALDQETKQMDTPLFGRLFVEEGKAYIQATGAGRGKLYVPPSPNL